MYVYVYDYYVRTYTYMYSNVCTCAYIPGLITKCPGQYPGGLSVQVNLE